MALIRTSARAPMIAPSNTQSMAMPGIDPAAGQMFAAGEAGRSARLDQRLNRCVGRTVMSSRKPL